MVPYSFFTGKYHNNTILKLKEYYKNYFQNFRGTMSLSLKSIGSWSILLLMLMQFIPLKRINPPAVSDIQTPTVIKSSLKKACYDCHSNETRWTGIAYIAPISWLLSSTVSSGRNVLNYSVWNKQSSTKKAQIRRVIAQGSMHQRLYYTWNPDMQLTDQETKKLLRWLND